MDSEIQKRGSNVMEHPVDEYTKYVHVLCEADAVIPGSTKIKNLCIKPITVKKN